MRTKLKLLEDLQKLDLKMDGLQGEKGAMQEEIAALETKVVEAEAALAARREELAILEADKRDFEENLETENDNISRSEARLKEIKTQKEYQAVAKEITSARKLKAEMEEQILQRDGQIEELKGVIARQQEEFASLKENMAGQIGEVRERILTLMGGVEADQTSRDEIIKQLAATIVRRYTSLREMRRGIAVVEARDGSCLGCNMNLPPQLYNQLFRGDELITCPHCQRILILKREQEG